MKIKNSRKRDFPEMFLMMIIVRKTMGVKCNLGYFTYTIKNCLGKDRSKKYEKISI